MDTDPNEVSSTSSTSKFWTNLTSLPSSPEDRHRIVTRLCSMQDPAFGHSSIHPWPSAWELNGAGIVRVGVKTPQRSSVGAKEEDEVIPEEEAVCRFCFHVFAEDEHDVMKTKCKCKFSLGHQECANEWWGEKGNTKCRLCDQDVEFTEVSLVRLRLSSPSETKKGKVERGSSIGRFLSGCRSCFSM